MSSLRWRDFDEATFEEARRQNRPILLSIMASWCRWCRELDRVTFADEEVARRIEESFIPVRIDKDRRPDIDERYSAGGWPTVAILTPEGAAITRTTYLGPADMAQLLDEVLPVFRDKHEEITSYVEELTQRARAEVEKKLTGKLAPEIIRKVRDDIVQNLDPEYGGFGTGQKFPHPEVIDFAMIQWAREGDKQMRDVVTLTLDHLAAGEIHDREEGGFFRYSTKRDWSDPHYEKMLDSNVERIYCYLEASQLFENTAYREVAEKTLNWVLDALYDPKSGAFFGSKYADSEYYNLPREERPAHEVKVDRTIYTNWNCMAVTALLKAARVLARPDLIAVASKTLDFLCSELYAPGVGMYHYYDETFHLPGLLTDQAYTLRALIDYTHTTGDNSRLALAIELVETIREKLESPSGGFYDTAHGSRAPGSLKQRNRSILDNSVLAAALARLGYLSRKSDYLELARKTLETFVGDYRTYGRFVAGYARAVDLFFFPPVLVTVIGSLADERTQQLREAALGFYMSSRIVQVFDPQVDESLLEQSGYKAEEQPVAYVEVPRFSHAQVFDPHELPAIMRQVESSRARD